MRRKKVGQKALQLPFWQAIRNNNELSYESPVLIRGLVSVSHSQKRLANETRREGTLERIAHLVTLQSLCPLDVRLLFILLRYGSLVTIARIALGS